MKRRFASLVAVLLVCVCVCATLSGCGIEQLDEETRKSVGFALGLLIIAASGIGFLASNRYYGRKRRRVQQRKRQHSKTRKKR